MYKAIEFVTGAALLAPFLIAFVITMAGGP